MCRKQGINFVIFWIDLESVVFGFRSLLIRCVTMFFLYLTEFQQPFYGSQPGHSVYAGKFAGWKMWTTHGEPSYFSTIKVALTYTVCA